MLQITQETEGFCKQNKLGILQKGYSVFLSLWTFTEDSSGSLSGQILTSSPINNLDQPGGREPEHSSQLNEQIRND